MRSQSAAQRIVLVVLDGVRPDAIGRFELRRLNRLIARGAWTLDARTVSPSVTVAAVASLMTGVSPTILTAFGMEPPSWYMGRALVEALARAEPGGVAVA